MDNTMFLAVLGLLDEGQVTERQRQEAAKQRRRMLDELKRQKSPTPESIMAALVLEHAEREAEKQERAAKKTPLKVFRDRGGLLELA